MAMDNHEFKTDYYGVYSHYVSLNGLWYLSTDNGHESGYYDHLPTNSEIEEFINSL